MVFGLGNSILDAESISVYTLEVLTDAELARSVESLKKQIRILRLENAVLETSIIRLQPSLMAGVYSALDYATKWSQSQTQVESRTTIDSSRSQISRVGLYDHSQIHGTIKSRSTMFHRKIDSSIRGTQSTIKISKSILGTSGPKVNVEEKLELVFAVMEKEGNDLQKYRNFAKKQNDYLNAQLEEIDLRINNFEKWSQAFEQEVIIEGVEVMTKRIPAETWIRFMMEQGKKIDRQIDKLRIKMSTTNIQHRKLRDDIKIKKDLSSRLVPVDLQVKSIEIKLALEKIEQKNTQLVELKALTGDANLNLTRYKYEMMNITNYLQKVINLKNLRKHQTIKMNAERDVLAVQVVSLEKRLEKIQKKREMYLVPDIVDYVAVKNKLSDLNSSIKRLKTSLNIKRLALSNFRKEKSKSMVLFSAAYLKSGRSLGPSDRQISILDMNTMKIFTQSDLIEKTVYL